MKKIKRIVLALVAAVTLFGCKGQVSENTQEKIVVPDFSNVESAITDMKAAQKNIALGLFEELSKIDGNELYRSSFFKDISSKNRSEVTDFDFLTDEEEDFFVENITEEEKERILQLAQSYLDEYAEIAKVRVFDEENLPEGLIETDEEIRVGDMVYSKMTPDGLSQVYELAKNYYNQNDSSRGAYLGVSISPFFKAGWTNGKVSYAFDGFPSEHKSDMRQCMSEWKSAGKNLVSFSETKSFNWWRNIWWNAGTLRVLKISPKDLSAGTLGQTTPGYCPRPYLYIDNETFNLSYNEMMQTFRHELGHALGLQHEFDRPDRDKYVIIRDDRNWSDISVPLVGRIFVNSIGSYDYNSIMNYYDFYHRKNKDGSKGAEIQLSDILYISKGDGMTIQILYASGGY